MPFHPIRTKKRADAVIREIELLILRGVLRPGERLPAERDLAERLDVSRPTLREAIAALSEAGLLTARAGAGIYVAEVLGNAFSPALIALFQRHEEAIFDYLAFRRDLEGQAAARAATEGSEADFAVVTALLDKMRQANAAGDAAEETRLDAEFHMAILDASHNVVLLHMMRSMFDLLRQGVFYNRETVFAHDRTRASLLHQHEAIHDALIARDAEGTRQAVEFHLDYVREALDRALRARRNEEIARRRLESERARG